MIKNLRYFSLLLFWSVSGCIEDEPRYTQVSGHVTNSLSGQPQQGVKINMLGCTGFWMSRNCEEVKMSVETDAEGNFSFGFTTEKGFGYILAMAPENDFCVDVFDTYNNIIEGDNNEFNISVVELVPVTVKFIIENDSTDLFALVANPNCYDYFYWHKPDFSGKLDTTFILKATNQKESEFELLFTDYDSTGNVSNRESYLYKFKPKYPDSLQLTIEIRK